MLAKVKILNSTQAYLGDLTVGDWFLFEGNLFIAIGFDFEVGGVAEVIKMPGGIRQFLNKNNLVEKVAVNIIAKREVEGDK